MPSTEGDPPVAEGAQRRPEPSNDRLDKLAKGLEDADVVIVLKRAGATGFAWFKGIGRVPSRVDVSYGGADDPPLTIRHVAIKAGWSQKDWRALDRSGLHRDGSEQ